MHQTQRKSVCLPLVTKSVQVTWYKQAKGVQLEKMHLASTKRKSVSASKIVKGRAPVKTRAKRPPTGCQLESTQLALQLESPSVMRVHLVIKRPNLLIC